MSVAAVRELANDERMVMIADSFLGRRSIPFKATLFEKTGRSNWLVAWHQDSALPVQSDIEREGWGPMSVKAGVRFVHAPTDALSGIVALRLHLDASNANNGPLRVIPASHKKRYLSGAEFDEAVRANEPVECLVGKGGVIAMSPLLIHASSKCTTDEPRRVLHIEYAYSLHIEAEIQLAVA